MWNKKQAKKDGLPFKQLYRDMLFYIFEQLIIPATDPHIVELTNQREAKKVEVLFSLDSCGKSVKDYYATKNRHYGLLPITAQHKYLRRLAICDRHLHIEVSKYRKKLAKQLPPIYGTYCISKTFLDVEKAMTIQHSKHDRALKLRPNKAERAKIREELEKAAFLKIEEEKQKAIKKEEERKKIIALKNEKKRAEQLAKLDWQSKQEAAGWTVVRKK